MVSRQQSMVGYAQSGTSLVALMNNILSKETLLPTQSLAAGISFVDTLNDSFLVVEHISFRKVASSILTVG